MVRVRLVDRSEPGTMARVLEASVSWTFKAVLAKEPEVTTPNLVILSWTALGKVEEMDGTPAPEVIRTPLLAVANPAMVLFEEEYNNWLAVVVAGYVAVDQAGVVDAPESKTWLAVAVPERMLSLEASE